MADLFLGRPRSRRYPKFNIRRDIPAVGRIAGKLAKRSLGLLGIWQNLAFYGDFRACRNFQICNSATRELVGLPKRPPMISNFLTFGG